jgi:hypothetical protein
MRYDHGEKEKEIVCTLRESYSDRIILIITHRHETIQEADLLFRLGAASASPGDHPGVSGPRAPASWSLAKASASRHGEKVERSGENRERNGRCLTLPLDT